jgi:hypothetical protein
MAIFMSCGRSGLALLDLAASAFECRESGGAQSAAHVTGWLTFANGRVRPVGLFLRLVARQDVDGCARNVDSHNDGDHVERDGRPTPV